MLDVLRLRAQRGLAGDPVADRVRVVASFAEAVTELAATDAAASQISLRAARELSLSVLTGLSRVLESTEPAVVGMVGGVFRSSTIRSRFEELVAESRPDVRFLMPHGSGLDGVAALLALREGHPLTSLIAVAENSARTGCTDE